MQELLQQRPDPSQERGRFVAIFEQLCQAVGYAHAHGVLHRDLKPSNVMVGAFGEVQVMDWGLAKVLDDTSTPRQQVPTDPQATVDRVTAMDTPERGDSATRTGSVLGTPAYMAPEQAAGQIRQLDARSDVFSLGAILCQILTGRPPYHGTDGEAVRLQAVRGETAAAFTALDACGAEPDLVALCKRCLAFKQEDRPADGTAVAAIRQAAEERAQQAERERAEALVRAAEQAKRRRLAMLLGSAIAAVLLAGLAVSLWQMERALRAEAQATANAEEAERNAVAARAERDAKEQEWQRAEAALAAETRARAAERQARDQAMTALGLMTDEMVEHQLARNPTLTEANKEFLRKVIKHFEGFAAITANDADSRAIRAEGYARVGRMRHRLGELKEAEAAYRDALAIQKQLAAEFPTRPDYRQNLARSHNNLGVLLRDTGRLKEAEAAYRDALKLQQQLVAEFPTRPDYRQELARSHTNLGILLYTTGRPKEAEVAWREALALQQQLAAEFPSRLDYRQELARSHTNLGNLLRETGRPQEAETAYRDALKLQEQLADEFPTRPDYRQELARSYTNLGILLYTTGRPKEAEVAWREALALQKQLAAEFPSRLDYRQELARSHTNLGNLLRDTGRPKEAEAAYRDALKLQEQLADEFPTRPDLRQELARSYTNLGNLMATTGRPKEAEVAWREALALQKQLAAEFLNMPDYQNETAGTLGNLAILCNQRREFLAAKKYLKEAQPHHQAALKANPRHPTYRQFYHNNLLTLVQAQAGLLDPAAAVQAAQTLRDLDWGQPGNTYDAACALALCIPIVEKHEKLDAEKRKAAVQFYGDKAMEMLRLAVEKGWKNAAHMEKDSDLDPLRSRADFQKLLQELDRPR